MAAPFNMPDEFVQGFFKSGQTLLHAYTGAAGKTGEAPSTPGRMPSPRARTGAGALLAAADGPLHGHGGERDGAKAHARRRTRARRPALQCGRLARQSVVQPAQADLPAQLATAQRHGRGVRRRREGEAQAAFLRAPVHRLDEPRQLSPRPIPKR